MSMLDAKVAPTEESQSLGGVEDMVQDQLGIVVFDLSEQFNSKCKRNQIV